MAVNVEAPHAVLDFLGTPTPESWVRAASGRLPELLLDHANCELKAASTAVGIIYRYAERRALADRMSRLAREELRHFEQVRMLLERRSIPFRRVSASRYAASLNAAVRPREPERLLDRLLVGALIEARSCERFAVLAPGLPDDVGAFYRGLLASEARHFEHYLSFARSETGVAEQALQSRLADLKTLEAGLITSPDPEFHFHSGTPERTA